MKRVMYSPLGLSWFMDTVGDNFFRRLSPISILEGRVFVLIIESRPFGRKLRFWKTIYGRKDVRP